MLLSALWWILKDLSSLKFKAMKHSYVEKTDPFIDWSKPSSTEEI